jgi:hypothetical protein
MDFNSITTPSELIEQNNQITEDGKRGIKLLEDVLEEGPRYGLCTAKILIEKLITMHEINLEEESEAGKLEEVKVWTTDLVKLQMISDILDDVEL